MLHVVWSGEIGRLNTERLQSCHTQEETIKNQNNEFLPKLSLCSQLLYYSMQAVKPQLRISSLARESWKRFYISFATPNWRIFLLLFNLANTYWRFSCTLHAGCPRFGIWVEVMPFVCWREFLSEHFRWPKTKVIFTYLITLVWLCLCL